MATALACLAVDSKANSTQDAVAVVESSISQLDTLITSDLPSDQIADGIELLFTMNIDATYMARAALGHPWRTASRKQKIAFTRVFRRYLAEKYSRYFRKFIGTTYTVRNARTTRNEQTFEVITTMYVKHGSPANVYWHLASSESGPRIRNMIVGDWNLLALEKTVIRNLLSQYGGSLNTLINMLPRRYQDR